MLPFLSLNQSFSFNSDSFARQAGGLKRVAPPISMAYTTPARPARCATTALNGTTGKAPIWWRRWRLWWCVRPISGSVISDETLSPQIKYDRHKKIYVFGLFSDFILISIHRNIFLNYIFFQWWIRSKASIYSKQTRLAGKKKTPF